jgi:hypothetical protein
MLDLSFGKQHSAVETRLLISGCSFFECSSVANPNGGALSCLRGALSIDTSVFAFNSARECGGAVFTSSTSPVLLVTICFLHNQAGTSGGGCMFSSAASATINLTNSTLDQSADDNACVGFFASAHSRLASCVLSESSAAAGGSVAWLSGASTAAFCGFFRQQTESVAYLAGDAHVEIADCVFGNFSGVAFIVSDSSRACSIRRCTFARQREGCFRGGDVEEEDNRFGLVVEMAPPVVGQPSAGSPVGKREGWAARRVFGGAMAAQGAVIVLAIVGTVSWGMRRAHTAKVPQAIERRQSSNRLTDLDGFV